MATAGQTRNLRHAAEAARDLVRRVGVVVRDLQGRVKTRDKGSGLGPVTEADFEAERLLIEGLDARCPGDAILREATRQPAAPDAEWLWCVDPLDGTRAYSQGLPEYAVMGGRLHRGAPAAGAIALPGEDKTFWGWAEGVALSDDERPIRLAPLHDPAEAVAVHTRSRVGPGLKRALEQLGIQQTIAAGSVGYKVAQILQANNLRSLTVVHMEVPCCSGLTRVAREAIVRSGKPMRFKDETVSLKGDVIRTEMTSVEPVAGSA